MKCVLSIQIVGICVIAFLNVLICVFVFSADENVHRIFSLDNASQVDIDASKLLL